MRSGTVIRVENVTKTYRLYRSHADRVKETFHPFRKKYSRPFDAIGDISLSVERGESLGIIGRNGSGKSTLLQIISGTLQPTSGIVEVSGKISALLELGTGFNPDFTGRENVYLSASIVGLSKEEIDAKFDEIAAFADIGDFMDQPVKLYSSGMMVRLAFAVQTAVEPEIMLVDEAIAVGDMRFAMKCFRRMKELKEKGTAFLFVSHDMASVVNFCQKVIWLHDGKIVETGPPRRVTMNYSIFMSYGLMASEEETSPQENALSSEGMHVNVPEIRNAEIGAAEVEALGLASRRLQWVDLNRLPSTGAGGAVITRIALSTPQNEEVQLRLKGGEIVEIFLEVFARIALESPIVCADFRDRKGNLLFGLNTYFLAEGMPKLEAKATSIVNFRFRCPLLLNGEYSISVAVADGTYLAHLQHHIVNEAIVFRLSSPDLPRNHYLISLEDVKVGVISPTLPDNELG
jgi:ABC-type polysaccharide/polyol phosphate transport system ATPase subunit